MPSLSLGWCLHETNRADSPPFKRWAILFWTSKSITTILGSCTGWDIMRNGKIACCRVNYDDYINFEIEILTPKEINEYKKKFTSADKTLVNRLATLKEMLKQSLITNEEFDFKIKEILQQI